MARTSQKELVEKLVADGKIVLQNGQTVDDIVALVSTKKESQFIQRCRIVAEELDVDFELVKKIRGYKFPKEEKEDNGDDDNKV